MTHARFAERVEVMVLAINQRLDRICERLEERTAPLVPLMKPRRKRLAKILPFRPART